MDRRSFIRGAVSLIAAPVVVRAASLMPVRGIVMMPMVSPTVVAARGSLYLGGDRAYINTNGSTIWMELSRLAATL